MRALLDENLDRDTAQALTITVASDGDEYRHLLEYAPPATADEDIPAICQQHDFNALVTVNVKDFGARKVIYQRVMTAGIHVVVIRPGRVALTIPRQVGILANTHARLKADIGKATEPLLFRVLPSGEATPRILSEVLAEIEAGVDPLAAKDKG